MNVLLDRDGTIMEDRQYLSDPGQVRLYPGVGPALRSLLDHGFNLFLVTNQSGIGRGFFTLEAYRQVQQRLQELLAREGVVFQDQMFCPHAPEAGCSCRKPAPGMWERLVERHELDPAQSLMIGDSLGDLQFGNRAGLKASILVLTGSGGSTAQSLGFAHLGFSPFRDLKDDMGPADALARDLPAACDYILQRCSSACTRV